MPAPTPRDAADTRLPRSVLVVEDQALLRELLLSALEARGFEAIGAGSASEALRAFRLLDPDGVVMDVDLGPGPNGFDLAEMFCDAATGVAIVFLTNLPDPRFAGRAPGELPPGIAYLRKSAVQEIDVLVDSIDAAIRGAVESPMRHDRDPSRPLASATRRQIEVLRLVALGYTNPQIATQRGTTLKSVQRTVSRAFAALGTDGEPEGNLRVAAARRFILLSGSPLPLAPEDEPAA